MSMSAAAVAALKKLAAAAVTDKKVGKAVGGIIAGAVVVMITPILAIIAVFQSGTQLDFSALAAQAQSEQLAYFEQVMLAIEDEILAQNLQIDPLKAQMVFLCALQNREQEDDFYARYIACFASELDEFQAISEAFGVTFSADDIEKIGQLISLAQQSQTGPANNLHARIAALIADDEMPLTDGEFRSPLRDRDWKTIVTSGFGVRIHPISGERKFHNGLDFGLPEGTEIYAVKAGTVLIVGEDSSYGKRVVLYHGGGMATLYAHCSQILVSEGQAVTAETVIARSGNTGASTGPHLHLEVILEGVPQNPKNYIK